MPSAEVIVLPDATHSSLIWDSAVVNALSLQFLAGGTHRAPAP